jgi:Tol biopolymer transport system component
MKNPKGIFIVMLFLPLTAIISLRASVSQQTAGQVFERALQAEEVQGDLQKAISLYKKVLQDFPKNREIAAKSLLHMGQCYEKLGDAEASKAYQRVVSEFADQKEAVEQARALLAASGRERQPETGLTVQQKWVLPAGQRTIMRHVSPDGRYIPFESSGGVWLHDLTTGEDRKVIEAQTGEYLASPELSPDGKQIAYTRRTEKDGYELRIASLDGSRMRVLMSDRKRWLWPKAWSPDAKRILILRQTTAEGFSLALVSVADGSVQVLTNQDDASNGCFSPDGKYIVTYRTSLSGGQVSRVPAGLKLIPVDGSGGVPLFESSAANWAPFWAPDGRKILFLSDRSGTIDLWSIRVSGGRSEGEPELVKRDAGSIEPDPIGFTRDGLFYYKTSTLLSDIYTADLDPATGRVISKPARVNQRFVGSIGHPVEWSPDGQFLVYTRVSRRELGYAVFKVISIIVRSERTGEERELLPMPALASPELILRGLLWFPDGRSLLFSDHDYDKGECIRQIDVQTGQVKALLDRRGKDIIVAPMGFSADGKALLYAQATADFTTVRMMRRNTESGEERELFRMTPPDSAVSGALSADGRQLAYVIDNEKQKTSSLMIMPTEGGTPRELLQSKIPFDAVNWTRDNRHVLMVRYPESGPPELWSVSIDGGEPQPSGLATPGLSDVSVHPDGRRIAFCSSKGATEEVWVIKNLPSATTASRK